MSKPLVIYHANCADGFGAAFAAWLVLGDEAEYYPAQYNDAAGWPGDYEDREVYILDFSFPRPVMDDIFKHAKRVVWLDHHKTAFEMWCGNSERRRYRYSGNTSDRPEIPRTACIELDNKRSGAMLAWEYFHPGTEAPMLIKHIDDCDRWQFKIAGTKGFSKALWSYAPWTFEQWRDWVFQLDHNLDGAYPTGSLLEFPREGAAILRAHEQNVQAVVKGSARGCAVLAPAGDVFPAPFMSYGLAANCPPHLTSDVGHELANQSGTFGLCWTLNQTKPVANCSLRSNGDYDVSAIAKAFGGGGHKNAAGFEVPIATLLGWLI